MISPLKKLRNIIYENKLDAVLITSVSNIIYLTNYSGFSKEEREAFLFITQDSQYILTDGRYTQAVKKNIPNFNLIEISSGSSVIQILKILIQKHNVRKLGFEGHNLSYSEHQKFSRQLGKMQHVDLSSLRIIKNPDEIIKIKKACKLGDDVFKYILKKIKLGVSEKEIAVEIEYFIKKQNGNISFNPIVAFGANSAIPHHVPGNKKLTRNDKFILLDLGVKLENYCSDMTRTVFVGKPSLEQKKMYQAVLDSQMLAIKMLEKTNKAYEIDKTARDYIISQGYNSIPHGVGHGVGIDIHETPHLSPKSKDILRGGMVFSIEPGIYIPDMGGVRIEDLVAIENDKIKILSDSHKEITVI